jgi:hypothetical protein
LGGAAQVEGHGRSLGRLGRRASRIDARARIDGAKRAPAEPAEGPAMAFDLRGASQGHVAEALQRAYAARLRGSNLAPVAVIVAESEEKDARLALAEEARRRKGGALSAEERDFFLKGLVVLTAPEDAAKVSAGGVLRDLRARTGAPGLRVGIYTERATDWDLSGLTDAERRAVVVLQLVNALLALDVTGLLDQLSETLKADRLIGTQA